MGLSWFAAVLFLFELVSFWLLRLALVHGFRLEASELV